MDFALSPLQGAATLLSPAGRRARLIVLAFHRVLPATDPLMRGEADAAQFRTQLAALRRCFNVLSLAEACRALREGTLPARSVCLTFDDGYAANAEVALPLLREYGLTGTFFIATGFLNGGRMFNDTVIEAVRRLDSEADLRTLGLDVHTLDTMQSRIALIDTILDHIKYMEPAERHEWAARLADIVGEPLPDDLMMTDAQVLALHEAGMEIGGHTVSHPILTSIDRERAREEISRGRERLQALTGAPVESFAYPNGKPGTDYAAEHIDLLRETGFRQAVTTSWGVAGAATDLYQIPRLWPWDRSPARFVARLVRAYTQPQAATV